MSVSAVLSRSNIFFFPRISFQNFRNNYTKVSEAVSEKHKLLVEKDKELGLYILAPNKTKESICYPKVFSGHLGENVHKFVSDFKTAIEADQIRVKDEIKTLRI